MRKPLTVVKIKNIERVEINLVSADPTAFFQETVNGPDSLDNNKEGEDEEEEEDKERSFESLILHELLEEAINSDSKAGKIIKYNDGARVVAAKVALNLLATEPLELVFIMRSILFDDYKTSYEALAAGKIVSSRGKLIVEGWMKNEEIREKMKNGGE